MVREMREETGESSVCFARFRTYHVPLADGADAEYNVYSARLNKPAETLHLGEGQEHRFFAPAALDVLDIVPGTSRVLRDFLASPEYETIRR